MSISWGERGVASVLVGGQFGSEGKGLAASFLAGKIEHPYMATTNAGAQAGHTTRRRDRGYVTFHLPTTSVERRCTAYINAGAIIDWDVFKKEIDDCGVDPSNVIVHPRAAVILPEHVAAESDLSSSVARIGSTMHGVGQAISDKIMRRSLLAADTAPSWVQIDSIDLNNLILQGQASLVVEVPQGTDLSLNHGLAARYTTSRDCWVGSGLSDAGIHPSLVGQVAMVVRTYPIRVGSVYNELGELIGHSGPFYSDSIELDWARNFPHLEPERTTVTKRVRRISTWSDDQYYHACSLNRPDIVFLSFCNYLPSAVAFMARVKRMREIEEMVGLGVIDHVYSFSPYTEEVIESLDEAIAWWDSPKNLVTAAAP